MDTYGDDGNRKPVEVLHLQVTSTGGPRDHRLLEPTLCLRVSDPSCRPDRVSTETSASFRRP